MNTILPYGIRQRRDMRNTYPAGRKSFLYEGAFGSTEPESMKVLATLFAAAAWKDTPNPYGGPGSSRCVIRFHKGYGIGLKRFESSTVEPVSSPARSNPIPAPSRARPRGSSPFPRRAACGA